MIFLWFLGFLRLSWDFWDFWNFFEIFEIFSEIFKNILDSTALQNSALFSTKNIFIKHIFYLFIYSNFIVYFINHLAFIILHIIMYILLLYIIIYIIFYILYLHYIALFAVYSTVLYMVRKKKTFLISLVCGWCCRGNTFSF